MVLYAVGVGVLLGMQVFAYMPATLHHVFDSMEDVYPSNGIPDSLEAYIAGSTNVPGGYAPSSADLDLDGMVDLHEWIIGTDPLVVDHHFSAQPVAALSNGQITVQMSLPDYFGNHAEVFGKSVLADYHAWEILADWIPAYTAELTWVDLASANESQFFYMIFDADQDFDGDGYSDHREYFISHTSPTEFNYLDSDRDGLHDWWEVKLFGAIDTQDGDDDSDYDWIPNDQELVWLAGNVIQMYSDPSFADTDGDGLDDYQERKLFFTNPLQRDSDGDFREDGLEILTLRTDPHNPDVTPPIVIF